MKYLKAAINLLIAIGRFFVWLLPFLKTANKELPESEKETEEIDFRNLKWAWILILIPLIFAVSCTKNYYDESLRNILLEKHEVIINEELVFAKDFNGNYKFTVIYLAGIYRLALLGQGDLTEDEIADEIEGYKIALESMRCKELQAQTMKAGE